MSQENNNPSFSQKTAQSLINAKEKITGIASNVKGKTLAAKDITKEQLGKAVTKTAEMANAAKQKAGAVAQGVKAPAIEAGKKTAAAAVAGIAAVGPIKTDHLQFQLSELNRPPLSNEQIQGRCPLGKEGSQTNLIQDRGQSASMNNKKGQAGQLEGQIKAWKALIGATETIKDRSEAKEELNKHILKGDQSSKDQIFNSSKNKALINNDSKKENRKSQQENKKLTERGR